ncbi:ATP synthase F1 subunit epsilon [Pigmentiphaga sp. NML080357]|uniref:ATP synthase F1 subunit epsilon n=1 Tax=Pigmentiphaga sp. NML080357 TaxID=2008675 RepID=UPI000B40E563|nr:ATP synthase F1 subunit epsilon [Pigmentiphaga sp. NML080357]OVZ60051.1 ATP synthase F1 subunit epsilon [Pigmentiphaga sp. NML080357]
MLIDIVNAEATVFSGNASFVRLPGKEGSLGILPGHIPLLTWLREGVIYIRRQEGDEQVYVSGGLAEVMPQGVTVLADTAVRTTGMDEARASQARTQALNRTHDRLDAMRYAAARAELLTSLKRGR